MKATGILNILDSSGHSSVPFSAEDFTEAETTFKEKVKMGLAYKTDPNGENTHIREFDPTAKEITITGQPKGG